MSPEVDRRVFGDLSYGLYIVTSRDGDQFNGQIVNTVIQVTSDPPRVAVIINKKNLTHDYISRSKVFGVSVLDESTPMKFLGPFGFRSGRDVDKFSQVQFKEGVTGCPLVIEHAISLLEAEVFDQIDLGSPLSLLAMPSIPRCSGMDSPSSTNIIESFSKGNHPQTHQLIHRPSKPRSLQTLKVSGVIGCYSHPYGYHLGWIATK